MMTDSKWLVNLGTRKGNFVAVFDDEEGAKRFSVSKECSGDDVEYVMVKQVKPGRLISVD